jgi:hypothetical protein
MESCRNPFPAESRVLLRTAQRNDARMISTALGKRVLTLLTQHYHPQRFLFHFQAIP